VSLRTGVVVFALLCYSATSRAQSPTAVVNGQVRDTSGAAIPNATVEIINDATRVHYSSETNREGIYSVPNLPPGTYHIQVSKTGFKTIVHPDLVLHVQDADAIGFTLPVGATSDTVTVEGGAPLINTESAAVSTVVDRQFAENLPMNGRSFQTLIQLTPGVVLTPTNSAEQGQFSVSGQRTSANYWTVDGVSANVGTTTNAGAGNALGGAVGTFSVLGGTNSLVSVDALQEFRIQTSTYAPEFGRTPGGQISIVTRSGTNQFHGTAFDYLRNDILDANDWFADSVGLPKPRERQNDFGGTLGGPILKDRTFFFFSYEGLRLRLPLTALTTVPDLSARQAASSAMQPFLNAYPLPNGTDNIVTGVAQFNATFSNPASLDACSLRVDHKLNGKLTIFGRYNYSPSQISSRGPSVDPLSVILQSKITTQTATVGATWIVSPKSTNDLRFNYSRSNGSGSLSLDNFGGAVPLASLPFPSPFTPQNALFVMSISALKNFELQDGRLAANLQQQINVVDDISLQMGSHSLKLGIDFRRLSPSFAPPLYVQTAVFGDVPSAGSGNLLVSALTSARQVALLFHNLGAFAQDTWRVKPRLTVTYGVRWDVDFAPSSSNGVSLPAVTGYNLNNLSNLIVAPPGTSPFHTTYGNFAPRLGVAYQLSQSQDWQTVLRGGFGIFYDLVTSNAGNDFSFNSYPFGAFQAKPGGTFPLGASGPPPIMVPGGGLGTVFAFDPNMKLPYTLEWNVAVEQGLGMQQSVTASYVGSGGHRLLQTAEIISPNANYSQADLIGNTATSDYHALQLQFQRRLARGLQVLASYTWAHSIDDGSTGSTSGNFSNTLVPGTNNRLNRGDSDFDIRNTFSAAVTYDVPAPKSNAFTNVVVRGWSLENIIQARTAPPVNVQFNGFFQLLSGSAGIRPDVIPGIPLYLYGPQYPGGKAINNNPGAVAGGCPADGSQSVGPFCPPPYDPNTFIPLRQGSLGRNALRGFGATQWDFAVQREFPIRESLRLKFRAEMFNLLNHPNFGPPQPLVDVSGFGVASQMLGQSLSGPSGSSALNPLYQMGGPRSIQLALKLTF
jgi:outer membrane receptor protein involved in Fe transport